MHAADALRHTPPAERCVPAAIVTARQPDRLPRFRPAAEGRKQNIAPGTRAASGSAISTSHQFFPPIHHGFPTPDSAALLLCIAAGTNTLGVRSDEQFDD